MSTFDQELAKGTVQKWRQFAGDNAFIQGINWLRFTQAPKISGVTPVEKFEAAVAWNAYQQALSDVEDKLTALPIVEKSIDEPPLEMPEARQ